MPTTHTGPCKHKNNKLCAISSNAPKKLLSHKNIIGNSNLIINDKLFQNEMVKSEEWNKKLNVTTSKKQTCVVLAKFLHAICVSPTVSTFTKAINNNHFTTWPGLSSQPISKHLPKSIYTYQGHLQPDRLGMQSISNAITIPEINQDHFTTFDQPNVRSRQVCYALIDHSSSATGCMYLTRRFPNRFRKEMNAFSCDIITMLTTLKVFLLKIGKAPL